LRKRALALTTINGSDNRCLQILNDGALAAGIPFYIAGDTKTPANFSLPGCTYLSISEQERLYPDFCRLLPTKHYTRKNVAYLAAMHAGIDELQETDDDNFPKPPFWNTAPQIPLAVDVLSGKPWANVYAAFSKQRIWPRGLPLEFVHHAIPAPAGTRTLEHPLILQGLADENPDVDAVFRMTFDLPVSFEKRAPVMIAEGSWCPFNSQNTLFHRKVFPLLYLPSYCSFRMTDIWRSFVAQRCLWELGQGVVFHESTVHQERNEHKLLRDFEDEVPGYLLNDKIRIALEQCRLDANDLASSLILCYEAMIKNNFVKPEEMGLVRKWAALVTQYIA
jgi:hypothetical protein